MRGEKDTATIYAHTYIYIYIHIHIYVIYVCEHAPLGARQEALQALAAAEHVVLVLQAVGEVLQALRAALLGQPRHQVCQQHL